MAVAAGGALGALLRYVISQYFGQAAGVIFPWGTLVINISGSFAMGLLHSFALAGTVSPHVRAFLAIGLLGAFTTFSTFTLESIMMLREGEVLRTFVYVASSVLAGLLSVFAGLTTGQCIAGGGA